jgi:putative membrane protein
MRPSRGTYDPAAQLERTALAWHRTSIAILANGALLARAGLGHAVGLLAGVGVAVALAGAMLWVLAAMQYSARAGSQSGHLLAGRPRAVLSLAAFVTLLSVLALVATVVR